MADSHAAAHVEGQKLAFDYLKHLTTLSTTIIVLGATFLERLKDQADGQVLIIFSSVSLLLTVVLFTLASLGVINSARSGSVTTAGVITFTTGLTVGGLLLFLVGITSLTSFIVVNVQ